MPTHVRFIEPRRRSNSPVLFLVCLVILFGVCALLMILPPTEFSTDPPTLLGP